MNLETWVTIALTLATGFGVWMFRIDRICTRLESKLDEVGDWRAATVSHISAHAAKLDDHAIRITKLEARGERG